LGKFYNSKQKLQGLCAWWQANILKK